MIIELEKRVQPRVLCVKYQKGCNLQEVLEVLGTQYHISYCTEPFELIVTHKHNKSSFYVRDGQYIINDGGRVTVSSAYALLQNYSYLDCEAGMQIEDDAEKSKECRSEFFKRVKDFLGE